MYKVIAHSSIYEKVDYYGELFFNIFLSRFSDTGLWEAEKLIQKQYLEASDILVQTIIDSITTTLSRDFIYHTPLESWQRETSFRMGNRRIFLTYEEDEEDQVRYITDIEILRK